MTFMKMALPEGGIRIVKTNMIITTAIAIGLVKHLWDAKSSSAITSGTSSSTTTTTTTTTTTKTTIINGQVAEPHKEEHKEHKEELKEENNDELKENKEKKEKKENKNKSSDSSSSDSEPIPYVSVNDCLSCTNPCEDMDHPHYPAYLKIDTETPLLNSTKPYTRHVLISTGQDDWVAHIDEDKDSLAPYMQEAIDTGMQKLRDENPGKEFPRLVLTNSSRVCEHWGGEGFQVIVLPDQIVVNNVTKDMCHDFFEAFLRPEVGHAFTQPEGDKIGQANGHHEVKEEANGELSVEMDQGGSSSSSSSTHTTTTEKLEGATTIKATKTVTTFTTTTTNGVVSSSTASSTSESSPTTVVASSKQQHARVQYEKINDTTRRVTVGSTTFVAHRWAPKAVIMICSHRKRDKRCGVTAAILGKEFKRILRSKDIYGDGEGDVEIWMISHIGGHKFAGNVIVHKSEGMAVWYGRVDPCHCQAIVDVTIEQGQVIQELYRGSMVGSFNLSKKKLAW
ncbi:hypothetical protein BG003_007401 [Podila horticola]|nr:hypothetical protein BG003_007401 [Podila horticola]